MTPTTEKNGSEAALRAAHRSRFTARLVLDPAGHLANVLLGMVAGLDQPMAPHGIGLVPGGRQLDQVPRIQLGLDQLQPPECDALPVQRRLNHLIVLVEVEHAVRLDLAPSGLRHPVAPLQPRVLRVIELQQRGLGQSARGTQ